MNEHYDETSAAHYAAYRPPLHRLILSKVLAEHESYEFGLDVGCGTGHSSVALTRYCQHVVGIEPSDLMLKRASWAANIEYMRGSAESIPVPDRSADIVTLAGSLFYVNISSLVVELKRVCRVNAFIVPYDFRVSLEGILSELQIRPTSNYDPAVNLSGKVEFDEIALSSGRIDLELMPSELAHLILATSPRFQAISKKFSSMAPFDALHRELMTRSVGLFSVEAEIFYSKYRIKG